MKKTLSNLCMLAAAQAVMLENMLESPRCISEEVRQEQREDEQLRLEQIDLAEAERIRLEQEAAQKLRIEKEASAEAEKLRL
jgi:uncharacterized protein YaiL (DUF2058 family)